MMKHKFICIGDSITWGYPYGPEYSWVGISSRNLNLPLVNKGVNGETAGDLLQRFKNDVLNISPTYVFIMVGTNDASIGVPLKTYQDHIIKMCTAAKEAKINPILGLPIPSFDKWLEYSLEKYRFWLKEYCSVNCFNLVDFSPAMHNPGNGLDEQCYADDVHPSRKGYHKMGEEFTRFFKGFHHIVIS